MTRSLKEVAAGWPAYETVRRWRVKHGQRGALKRWERAGRPVPPPHAAKQRVLREYAREFGLDVLVETGTYYGDMVEALRRDFERVYSIELSRHLYERALRRFRRAANVTLVEGDSGVELARIVNGLDRPALFWLDGHYSGGETAKGADETPIYAELHHVVGSPVRGHVIVIDDARLFGTDPAYPTIEEVRRFIRSLGADLDVTVQDDSIRVTPRDRG